MSAPSCLHPPGGRCKAMDAPYREPPIVPFPRSGPVPTDRPVLGPPSISFLRLFGREGADGARAWLARSVGWPCGWCRVRSLRCLLSVSVVSEPGGGGRLLDVRPCPASRRRSRPCSGPCLASRALRSPIPGKVRDDSSIPEKIREDWEAPRHRCQFAGSCDPCDRCQPPVRTGGRWHVAFDPPGIKSRSRAVVVLVTSGQ